jgi:hypothetical protein
MSVPEYSYNVDATGCIRTLVGNDSWQPTGAVLLDGVQKTAAWFGPFQPPERDLLRVAAAVLHADRLSPRRGELCTSCIFRRIALFAAGVAEDPTRYRDVPTRRHGLYELRAFEHHADQLESCMAFDDLVQLDADARFASRAPTEPALTKDEAEGRVLAMYATYCHEISEFFARARPVLHGRPRHLRKENERDLFAATG